MGRKYELAAGLIEISYRSGAKVILQGPCAYEVDSARGGYLSLGKLTARVEKLSAISDQLSEISKSPNLQISKFVVRTPTAVVTDLGTEFGVEVERSGATRSHVFRGKVELRVAENGRQPSVVPLREGESAEVKAGPGNHLTLSRGTSPGAPGRRPSCAACPGSRQSNYSTRAWA